jgi:hypothetical protein
MQKKSDRYGRFLYPETSFYLVIYFFYFILWLRMVVPMSIT